MIFLLHTECRGEKKCFVTCYCEDCEGQGCCSLGYFILQSHNLIWVCLGAHLPRTKRSTHCFAFHFAVCLNWLKNKLLRLLFKAMSLMLKLRSCVALLNLRSEGRGWLWCACVRPDLCKPSVQGNWARLLQFFVTHCSVAGFILSTL